MSHVELELVSAFLPLIFPKYAEKFYAEKSDSILK